MEPARFWHPLGDQRVACDLCRFRCQIAPGQRGRCGVRENRGGELFSLVYGLAVAEHVDPIEKKPLYHYLPGSLTYSIATVGCNFRCRHCQNYAISQADGGQLAIVGHQLPPAEVVRRAQASACRSVAFTYTEPVIFYEYLYDTARLAKQAGLGTLVVSNGYFAPEPLAELAPWLDAANIDLKGFSERFYRETCGASLVQVLEGLRDFRRHGIWLEVTTLLIPGLNDAPAELAELARFLVDDLGADTPWHVSRFHPAYLLTELPPTPLATLELAAEIGQRAGLRYVYQGNRVDGTGSATRCPGCQALLLARHGFGLAGRSLAGGSCPGCGMAIAGRWQ